MLRAGYGMTKNPLPWSRPMRGSYPFDINNNATAAGTYDYVTTLAHGIPAVNLPDTSSGKVVLPRGVYIRSPNLDEVDRRHRSSSGTCRSSAGCLTTSPLRSPTSARRPTAGTRT